MSNCLKPSQANNSVSLPVATGNDVESSTFQTLNSEPFELSLSMEQPCFLCRGYREGHRLSCFVKAEKLRNLLSFQLLLGPVSELWWPGVSKA